LHSWIERVVETLVRDFEDKTNCKVESIYLKREYLDSKIDDCKIDVRL